MDEEKIKLRDSSDRIKKLHVLLTNSSVIQEILNALSSAVIVLNEKRQVVIANNLLIEMSGHNSIEEVLGLRPGEVIRCIHSDETPHGCGTSPSCKFCGALETVLNSQDSSSKTTGESRITTSSEGENVSLDLQITSTPFYYECEQFYIVSLNDISSEKRKKVMERVFFHDIMNTAGGLRGLIQLLPEIDDETERKNILYNIENISGDLVEEILSQRDLVYAENGELVTTDADINSADFLKNAVAIMGNQPVAKDKFITIAENTENFIFLNDIKILKRITVNMIKNALEASKAGDSVKTAIIRSGNDIRLSVWNKSVMSEEVRSQVFQRSFSTKGRSRGLGTYSIKLFTEKYLGGSVSFRSEEGFGTEFTVAFPIQNDNP